MPYISQTSIQEINDRLDAFSLFSEYLTLEKRGDKFWARCPFHQEKTASFSINPELKLYYCFGCQKGGTLVNFIMEMDSLNYVETIELLAKKLSIKLVYEGSGSYSREEEEKKKVRDDLFELYQRISGTFKHFLQSRADAEIARESLKSRSVSSEMIDRFKLGFTPNDRYWLHDFLLKKGYSKEFLSSSGLFSTRYESNCLFSDRLMFPISDRQGRIIAFGGRYLGDSDDKTIPKYINSPESLIFKKRESLYGLDLALPEIKKTKTVYITEGYMDVISMHQAGISNTVAPLGTAFTEEQAKILKPWADNIILYFDSDDAGQKAAISAIFTSRKCGLSCSLVVPHEDSEIEAGSAQYKDPAEILKNFGSQALQISAKSIIFDFEYLINKARILHASGNKGQNSEGKARALAFLFPYMDLLESDLQKNSCIEAAADGFGLLPAAVTDEYNRYTQSRRGMTVKNPKEDNLSYPIRINDELSVLFAVAVNYVSNSKVKLFSKLRSDLDLSEIDDPNAREIYIALEECARYEEIGIDDLLHRISSAELKSFFMEHCSRGEFSINEYKVVTDGIKKIKARQLKRKQEEIIIKLRSIKRTSSLNPDSNEQETGIRELLSEKMRIDDELIRMEQGRNND